MNNAYQTPDAQITQSRHEDGLRRTALFDYVLHICCVVFSLGTLQIVPLIINYIKRPNARGTVYESHFTWMIRSAWWTLFWLVVTGVVAFFSLGILAFFMSIPVIWFVYRMIKGIIYLNDHKPMPV